MGCSISHPLHGCIQDHLIGGRQMVRVVKYQTGQRLPVQAYMDATYRLHSDHSLLSETSQQAGGSPSMGSRENQAHQVSQLFNTVLPACSL